MIYLVLEDTSYLKRCWMPIPQLLSQEVHEDQADQSHLGIQLELSQET